jgi:serine/threonine-protein kinase HipA
VKLAVRYLGVGRDEVVGHLLERDNGTVYFEYEAEWTRGGRELSPLYLPNETGGSVSSPTPSFGPLFGLFSDSLPDWWGEQLMRRFFTDQGIPWRGVTSLQRLGCQGSFGMGALGYEPDLGDGVFRDVLTVEVGELVRGAMEFAHGSAGTVVPGLVRSGLSPGGAQPKVSLGFSEDLSEVVAGGGELPDGFQPWLLKFDLDPELEAGKEEYAYSLMARAAGVGMPETRLMETEGGRFHFLIGRFDRDGGRRIHMHSYSGLTHTPVREPIDYDEVMNLARVLTGHQTEVEQLFRRAVFNVLAGNDDDHGRNHSFLMDGDGNWRLSPAYDLTRGSNPLVGGMRAAAVLGKTKEVTRDDLQRLGDGQGVRMTEAVIDEVLAAVRDWERWAGEAGLSRFRTGQVMDELPGVGG